MNWIKRLAGILAITILLCIGASAFVGWMYKDDIKTKVLSELNQQFKTPISFNTIDISLFQHFPKATVSINKVLVNHPKNTGDTLAYINNLDLALNLYSLLTSEYNISLIGLNNGKLTLDENTTWDDIYIATNQQTSSDIQVLIDKILLNDVAVNYSNNRKQVDLALVCNDLKLNGNFSAIQFDLISKGDVDLKKLTVSGVNYIQQKNIRLNTSISVNTDKQVWQFNPSQLFYGNLPLAITGRFSETNDGIQCKLDATGDEWEIQELMDDLHWLPNYKNEWTWTGKANAKASVHGLWNANVNPTINLDVVWKNGAWNWKKHNWHLNKINLIGNYTNSTGSGVDKIKINEFTAQQEQTSLNIQGAVARLEDPFFNLWGTNTLDLSLLAPWLDTLGIKNLTGIAQLNFKTKGKANNQQLHWTDFFSVDSESSLTIENTTLAYKDLSVSNLNTTLFQVVKNTSIRDLTATVNGTNIAVKGLVRNWVGWQPNTAKLLKLELNANADEILLDNWLNKSNSQEESTLPNNLTAAVKINANHFVWDNFDATNLSGLVQFSNNQFTTTGFKFNHAKGVVITNSTLTKSNQAWHLTSNTAIKKIDVNTLFQQWNNFGQKTITHQQIKGLADAQALVNCDFDNSGVNLNTLYSLTDFTISNGSLTNNQALADIGDYLQSNLVLKAFVKVDELATNLNDLKFNKLHNLIEINDGKLIIPEMELTTNALALNVSGSHSFNQDIDYKFNFLLNDVMRRGKNKGNEDGVSSDGKRIFLKATGSVNNPSFGLDRAAARNFKNLQAEKDISKVSDDRFSDVPKEPSSTKFDFDWSSDTILTKDKPQDENKPDSSKTKFGKWLKKLENEDDKDKKEVDWEIEFPNQE